MRKTLLVGLVVWMCLGSEAATAKLYRWVDEQGVTHISDKPPPRIRPVTPSWEKAAPRDGASGPSKEAHPEISSKGHRTQENFCRVIETYRAAYQNSYHKRSQPELRGKRKQELGRLLPDRSVSEWRGVVERVDATEDGVVLSIDIGCHAVIKTMGTPVAAERSNTLIPPNSPLMPVISGLSPEDPVIFSGKLMPCDRDHLREDSLTEIGCMLDPEFVMLFTAIRPDHASPKAIFRFP